MPQATTKTGGIKYEVSGYEVWTYAADGRSEPARLVGRAKTLEEAERLADMGHGHWTPDSEGEPIAFHASASEGCGGRVVREVVLAAGR